MKATPRRQRVAKRGVDCDRTQSLLRLAHFIQVPINRRVKVGGEKVTQQIVIRLGHHETG